MQWCRVLPSSPGFLSRAWSAFGAGTSTSRGCRSMTIHGAASDPDVSSATEFSGIPGTGALPDTGGSEGKAVREEVARVMANPEVNGQPVALDFSSQGKKSGYSRKYASNWDLAFRKKDKSSTEVGAGDSRTVQK